MDPIIARISHNLVERVTGPMHFRLLLQPGMATFFAIRDGLKDARECKAPYFWGLFTDKGEREAMVKNGWKSVGKVFILAIVLDVVYQLIEHRWTVYPGRGSAGRDHSSHRALPFDPRTCESHRLRKTQSSQGTIGRRLEPYGNELPNRTHDKWPRPSRKYANPNPRVRLTGRSPSALAGQGRQPQRNKFNPKRNKPWLSNLISSFSGAMTSALGTSVTSAEA